MNKLVNELVDCIGTVPDTDCVALYNVDPSGALAVVYSRYSGMLHKIGQRYFSFSREDVDSFVWSTLDKALSTFRLDAGANFATYVTRLMRNTMRNEYRRLKVTSVQRDWFVDVEWEGNTSCDDEDNYNVFYSQGVEEDWSAIDITTSLPTLPLTDKQYAYIECIVRNGQILTDAEVAKEIGVTRAAVAGIKRSLAKKLDNFLD
nr:MAG TPA: RNA polymerase sigma factor [Caudoviricetes sp.]